MYGTFISLYTAAPDDNCTNTTTSAPTTAEPTPAPLADITNTTTGSPTPDTTTERPSEAPTPCQTVVTTPAPTECEDLTDYLDRCYCNDTNSPTLMPTGAPLFRHLHHLCKTQTRQ